MRVDEASPDDTDVARVVGALHAASRAAAYAGLVDAAALARVTPERQAAVWRDRLAQPHRRATLLVATTDQGEPVGFAHGCTDGPPAAEAQLDAIHVLPEHLGRGAGPLLLEAAVARFAAWGCSGAWLWVVEGNERAQAFYRREGWTHDGTRESHEVGGSIVPILRYRRPLPR